MASDEYLALAGGLGALASAARTDAVRRAVGCMLDAAARMERRSERLARRVEIAEMEARGAANDREKAYQDGYAEGFAAGFGECARLRGE